MMITLVAMIGLKVGQRRYCKIIEAKRLKAKSFIPQPESLESLLLNVTLLLPVSVNVFGFHYFWER